MILTDVGTALGMKQAIAFRAAEHVNDFLPMSRRETWVQSRSRCTLRSRKRSNSFLRSFPLPRKPGINASHW